MLKRMTLALAALFLTVAMSAQSFTGGVKGTLISRSDKAPVASAKIVVLSSGQEVATVISDAEGNFSVMDLADGMYDLVITSDDYLETTVNVTVNDGYVKNMFKLSLTPAKVVTEVSDENFSEFDLDDSGYSDSPVILFGQNDVFNNIAGYNFSDVRFKARGYNSEAQEVMLAGVKMNDAITGYSPYSLWSGLNEATRTKDTSNGLEYSDYGFGGYNGITNIKANANSVRNGLRASILTNSALYRLRLMMSYASGQMDNGWSYAVNVSARLGGNDWIKGVYYRSFGYYAAAEKKIDDANRIGFTFMAAPGERGAQNASTQEVYDLMGDNMYNSNWGYQNGKVRNARVKKTHEPIAIVKYDYTPNHDFSATATALFRFGHAGYTALDWYNSLDPRPDYYKNLPSYFYMADSDYGRNNYPKYAWAKEAWTTDYANTTHINWDRIYNVNQASEGGRARYVLENRRTDQRDFNLAGSFKWRQSNMFTLTGGANMKVNRTENYKILDDLLGGEYYLNIDSFAERDYNSAAIIQNDLDYYRNNGNQSQVLGVGDKYGYDYYAQIRKAEVWANGLFRAGNFTGNASARLGYTSFWRDGLYRKGLFAGLEEDGSEVIVNGENLTTYDPVTGEAITSKGKSEKCNFISYGAKLNGQYVWKGGHRVYANAGFFNDAPNFNQAFVSPRTRNTIVPNLTTSKTISGDINYQYSNSGYDVRITGYWTKIMDQSEVMSFYDDSQNSFTNFAMSGIDERHAGIELGFKVPTPVQNLSVKGVLSLGEYIYTSNPKMYQTIDNSAEIVKGTYDVTIPYWMSNPVYKKDASGNYVTDANGNAVVEKTQKHYVPSTPQLASSIGLSYNYNYWFIDADVNYFANSYLDMNPLYRTDMATAGPDNTITPAEIEYMTSQEKFDPAFLLNFSVGKSWYIQRKYQFGFSLSAKNALNNKGVKTGGYEQTRLIDSDSKERYYRFDPKYFYMAGANYMLNIYFRF